ncbi:ABC transporter ATP-binding protein [Methylopila jiangsuensis]|uniref:ABC transporter ATP-binding protein n=1 Tax=Methylopila jiangsuensis TaxID=586230 RepID=A0A9W6N2M2_9HYPH|nr:ABC transporter ATP-binding protein [Methylopila jiangsuensis]MDR6285597.1 branched-chain amino acid transport system ATP-binding protein [Methylopila jiangsuensis]GLK75356.1 ABC transporter ATP-binding protein [Methylopila jiangsuensis]
MTNVMEIRGLTKSFGGLTAVNGVDLTLPGKELHAIIGPNGAGKTTFFNLISGFLRADKGTVRFLGEDVTGLPTHKISRLGVARTLQVKSVFNGLSVHDNVWIAAQSRSRFLNPFRPAHSYAATARKVDEVMERAGVARHRDDLAGNLSYGDQALLEIAIALATEPRLLLLDEPVAGMSPEETDRTVATVRELAKTVDVVLIEHDMEVVFDIADTITVMNQGTVLRQGTPAEIAADPRVQDVYLGVPEDDDAEG